MTATTDHYLNIDFQKLEAQVAVLNDGGEVVKQVRVATQTSMKSRKDRRK